MRGTQAWPPPAPPPPAGQAAAGTVPIGMGAHGPGPELVGYARISTRGQKDDTQIADLTAAGVARIFRDLGVSGKLAQRPELDAAVAYMKPGDTFVITRLSRAMRSLRHFLNLAAGLAERDIGLRVLKQDIDTTTSTGRLVFHILAAIDEWMRELIVEGTLEGLEAARAKGSHPGQPRKLSPEQEDLAMEAITRPGANVAAVARSFKVSPHTLYRAAERRGIKEPPDGTGHGGRPPVDPETAAEVMKLLHAGANWSAAAAATGLSIKGVQAVWKRSGERGSPPGAGKPRALGDRAPGGRPRALTPEQEDAARSLAAEGASIAGTARRLGCSRQAVYQALERG